MSFIFGLLSFALILVSLFLGLLVLMQKTKDGGMGAALGGGATESAFGHETGNVLTNWTIKTTIAFFLLCLALYLGNLYAAKHGHGKGDGLLQKIDAPAAPAQPGAQSLPFTAPTAAPAAPTATSPAALPAAPVAPADNATVPLPAAPSPDAAPAAADAPKPPTP